MLWKSPIYRFRIPISEESDKLKEIVFNVTGSAPTFENVKDTMKGVFEKFLNSEEGKKVNSVIDFGAAKLRNTLYFLNENKKVAAVEFEELKKNSTQAQRIYKKCKKNTSLFEEWLFPYPFIDHKEKYDLGLLINVLPIMPVFAERLIVLQVLHGKIKEGGYILWYAQKEGSYKDRRVSGKYSCGNGVWMGDNSFFKTFFEYIPVEDVDEIMALSGFDFVKKYSAPGNDVRLYTRIKCNLFSEIITSEKIMNLIPVGKSIKDPEKIEPKIVKEGADIQEIIPTPYELSIDHLYAEALRNIPKGDKEDPTAPEKYHRLASQIIYRVFRGSLSGMELKRGMQNRLKVIDTVYKNDADAGFFYELHETFKIPCPYIIVEAKNYNFDPENPEFDQLSGRLLDSVGKFGILICRDIQKYNVIKDRCQGYLDDGKKHIIFLTDNDLIELLELSQDNDIDGINGFMDKKIRSLLFKSNN